MTTYDWPSVGGDVAEMTWRIRKAGAQFTGPFNGTRQAVGFMSERWLANITLHAMAQADSGAVVALMELLTGGVNRVRLPYLPRRVPRGTLRGAPTLAAGAAFGAMSLSILTTAGATTVAGDMLALGGQMVRCAANATANGAGVLLLPITTHLRATLATGTAVTWNRPTATFCMPSMEYGAPTSPRLTESSSVELEEVW